MIGDGYTDLYRCEFANEADCEDKEPDAGPVYCRLSDDDNGEGQA
jgi:hypothetical protein